MIYDFKDFNEVKEFLESLIEGNTANYALISLRDVVINSWIDRLVSKTQSERVITDSCLAGDYIEKRLKQGHQIRDDGYFTDGTRARSFGFEVTDSMLFKSKDVSQEQKIPYMAHLIENVAFDTNISADNAVFYLNIFDQITYRQACIIKMLISKQKGIYNVNLRNKPLYDYHDKSLGEPYHVLQELVDLYSRGLIMLSTKESPYVPPQDASTATFTILPNSAYAVPITSMIYDRMCLSEIPDDDVNKIVRTLS